MTKKTDPNYGKGEATIGAHDTLEPYIKSLKAKVKEAVVDKTIEIPLLPHSATQVLNLANNPNASFVDIEKVIVSDQVVAAQLLKVANSAFYRGATQITSIRDAMSRIGMRALKNLVMSLSMQSKIFRVAGYDKTMEAVWDHSISCAAIAQSLAKMTNRDADQAFLGGLLHDIGKPVLINVAATFQKELIQKQKAKPTAGLNLKKIEERLQDVLRQSLLPLFFDEYHSKVGALVAARWKLPPYLVSIAQHHHFSAQAKEDADIVLLISCANKLCHHFGYGHEEEPIILHHDEGLTKLGLDEAKTKALNEKIPPEVDSFVASFK